MKCELCNADSNWLLVDGPTMEEGLSQRVLYTAYFCRKCGKRFLHRKTGLLVGVAATAVLALTVVIGSTIWKVGGNRPYGSQPLEVAAQKGDAKAQLRLGMNYMDGVGVEQDPATAVRWIQSAAAQGFADAQYTLGDILQSGRGAPQNFALALEWYERAAQQNQADAQYRLGVTYRDGIGISRDKSKAYFWFILAAAQKHELAGFARDGLRSSLTPDQVLSIQRATQEWRPTNAAMMTSAIPPASPRSVP